MERIIKNRLTTSRLLLSKISMADAFWIFYLIQKNKRYLSMRLPWVKGICSLKKEKISINKMINEWKLGKSYCFFIKKKYDQVGIGMIGVIEIDEIKSSCEIGYWISEEYQSKGYISEALSAVEKELFWLGFKKIYLKMDSDNFKSIRLAVRNGYFLLDVKNKDFSINNSMKDTLIFSKEVCESHI